CRCAGCPIANGQILAQGQHQGFAVYSWETDVDDVRLCARRFPVDQVLDRRERSQESILHPGSSFPAGSVLALCQGRGGTKTYDQGNGECPWSQPQLLTSPVEQWAQQPTLHAAAADAEGPDPFGRVNLVAADREEVPPQPSQPLDFFPKGLGCI